MRQIILFLTTFFSATSIALAANVFTCPSPDEFLKIFNDHPWGSIFPIDGIDFQLYGRQEKPDPKNISYKGSVILKKSQHFDSGISCNYADLNNTYTLTSPSKNSVTALPLNSLNWIDDPVIPRFTCWLSDTNKCQMLITS